MVLCLSGSVVVDLKLQLTLFSSLKQSPEMLTKCLVVIYLSGQSIYWLTLRLLSLIVVPRQ